MTAEDSLALGIGGFRKRIFPASAGTVTWTRAGRLLGAVRYIVDWDSSEPIVVLNYQWKGSEVVNLPVWLQATYPAFGGKRWWWTCPLVVGGVPCNRRAGVLYLPPGARYFGCRRCYDLTYRSSQEAHQAERLFVGLARELGMDDDIGMMSASRLRGKRIK